MDKRGGKKAFGGSGNLPYLYGMNKPIIHSFRLTLLALLLVMTVCPALAQSQDEWTDKAYGYMEQDSLAQAEECFRHAIETASTSSQSAMLLANLGTVQHRRGKVREAIESYTKALEYSPMDITILMHRATAYMALGNDDKAYTDLCNVLDKRSQHVEALYYRAFIYMNRREYAAARTDYKQLLAADPSHANGLFGLAVLNQREGRLQTAEEQLSCLVDRYPDKAT